jgi:hypothetical protein
VAKAPDRAASPRVPFWAHQLAELLLGVVLLFEGARNGTHVVVMVAGGLLLLFTLVTDGPLAAWPRLPRRAHRVGDFVFAGVLAVSPFFVGVDDVLAIVLLEVAAVLMLWLALRGDFRPPERRRKRGKPAPVHTAPGTKDGPPDSEKPEPKPAPSVPSARDAGRALGRLRTGGVRAVGRAVGKASAERATVKEASAERATVKETSAERATEQREGDGGDESSPE